MADWFAMDGYGAYVWGAYLATLVILLWDIVTPIRKRRELRRQRPTRPARRHDNIAS